MRGLYLARYARGPTIDFVGESNASPGHTIRAHQVSVRASADNQLLRKPDIKKGDEPQQPKKLFSDAPAAEASASGQAAPKAM